jgi:hypothetical protein
MWKEIAGKSTVVNIMTKKSQARCRVARSHSIRVNSR